jgi:nitrite reductase/ring-hydroxylating ferredoxin subunit
MIDRTARNAASRVDFASVQSAMRAPSTPAVVFCAGGRRSRDRAFPKRRCQISGVLVPDIHEPPLRIHPDIRRLTEFGAVRFALRLDGIERDAFAVRFRGRVYAWVNSCRHQSLPLDFGDAHFFDERADALVCCHHGARYDPASGVCVDGPCEGARLTALAIEQRGNELWCLGRSEISGAASSD